ncbi:MAG: cupin domain-containing protein [Myxococcales bacterium]|nr:MAG: cupin domain-containing protein [Myxococcales bacterium]
MSSDGRRELLALGAPTALSSATAAEAALTAPPRALTFADTGEFPNSRLPALVYATALPVGADLAERFEALLARHGWTGAWRNGLYRAHHYHSTAHEALGVFRGRVSVRLGGPHGELLELRAGDALVIPAGVAHKNEGQSTDFAVLGAYPTGTGPDMNYGKPSERPLSDRRIAAVPIPPQDPVTGTGTGAGSADGGLPAQWRAAR